MCHSLKRTLDLIRISHEAANIVIMSIGWYRSCCRAIGVEQRHM